MASVEEYYNKIRNYNNLKVNLNEIVSLLENASKCVDEVKSDISNRYTINDDATYISKRIYNLDLEIEKTSNYLKNTIIPKIDSTINSLKNQIERIEYEEEKEKERLLKEIKAKEVKKIGNKTNRYK